MIEIPFKFPLMEFFKVTMKSQWKILIFNRILFMHIFLLN